MAILNRMSNTSAKDFKDKIATGGKKALAWTMEAASKGMNKLAKAEFILGTCAAVGGMALACYGAARGNADLVQLGAYGMGGLATGTVLGGASKATEFGFQALADKARE